jgi:hypothetical protein
MINEGKASCTGVNQRLSVDETINLGVEAEVISLAVYTRLADLETI